MQKKPVVLIICGVIVAIAIILLIVYLAKGGSTSIKDITTSNKGIEKIDVPKLILSAYPEEKTEGSVEISINATISGNNEIVSLTTPDGKTIGYTSDKTYEVDDNGEYTFTVTASNGKKATEVINIQNISKISADNPYIPEGFKQVEGTKVSTGFIIEDKNGNQYVWVPVESGIPERTAPSDKYLEDNYTASSLNNSIGKYYGFYIARYESSRDSVNGLVVARSVKGNIPWSNVSYSDAFDASRNTSIAYDYIGVKTALINSYAWDTALDWIDNSVTNYSSSKSYGNYSNQILTTGETESDIVNGIADMAGNLREWTTEKYDNDLDIDNVAKNETANSDDEITYRVVRGGSAKMDKIANSRIGQRTDLQDNYWGFRMILYKE